MRKGNEGHADIGLPRRAVYDTGGGHDVSSERLDAIDALADRKAGRDDILDDDHLFTRFDRKAAAKLEDAVDALGEDGWHAEMAGSLVAGNDAAQRGRDDL